MHLFDPRTNTFRCEDDQVELIEHLPEDPGAANGETADKLQRFNQATAPIRDVLKDIEGAKVPSLNIMAWIAKNVKVHVDLQEEKEEERGKVQVVLGEGDERERIEKERLAEQQRYAFSLTSRSGFDGGDRPIRRAWYHRRVLMRLASRMPYLSGTPIRQSPAAPQRSASRTLPKKPLDWPKLAD